MNKVNIPNYFLHRSKKPIKAMVDVAYIPKNKIDVLDNSNFKAVLRTRPAKTSFEISSK